MSLFASLFSSVSALNAQSQAMGMISDNIANVNTVGYKGSTARFETLVTNTAGGTGFIPGGVRARALAQVDKQGPVQASGSATDLAIAGKGFFVVNTLPNGKGPTLFTRAGSFRSNFLGNLVNSAGFFLRGWPLDAAGRLPGTVGNTKNTVSSSDLASLKTVNVKSITGTAAATTEVRMGANLDAGRSAFAGPALTSKAHQMGANDDMKPQFNLIDGEGFKVDNGSGVSATFKYKQSSPNAERNEFKTLAQLQTLINDIPGLAASISGPPTKPILKLSGDDPREKLVITDISGGGTKVFGATLVADKTYDATNVAKNLSSGGVTAHFSRTIRIFDAQGTGHDLRVNFLKVANNTWKVEITSNPASAVNNEIPGQIAAGTVSFNGDGSLAAISNSLSETKTIGWTNGSVASKINFGFGTPGIRGVGKTNGLSQLNGGFNVAFVEQNGSQVGELNGVSIDKHGFVIASFSNGQTKRVFKTPIATFSDVSKLNLRNGNAFAQTEKSGQFNLREAGKGGAGLIAPSALEAANVDLGTEFSKMIVSQRAFSANSKVITTVDSMLDELIRTKR